MVWIYGKLAIFFTRLHYRKLGEIHRRRGTEMVRSQEVRGAAMNVVGKIFDECYIVARWPEPE